VMRRGEGLENGGGAVKVEIHKFVEFFGVFRVAVVKFNQVQREKWRENWRKSRFEVMNLVGEA
jgi:hypothetical protein